MDQRLLSLCRTSRVVNRLLRVLGVSRLCNIHDYVLFQFNQHVFYSHIGKNQDKSKDVNSQKELKLSHLSMSKTWNNVEFLVLASQFCKYDRTTTISHKRWNCMASLIWDSTSLQLLRDNGHCLVCFVSKQNWILIKSYWRRVGVVE